MNNSERRIFIAGALLAGIGSILTGLLFGVIQGISFFAGGFLSAINLIILRHTTALALERLSRKYRVRVIIGYFLRLLLLPVCFYAMMHFFFLGVIAAVAGFATFSFGIFIEGVLEAFKDKSK